MERDPVVASLVSFGLGVVASVTPCVYGTVTRTVATFGATEETSPGRRAALSATFVLGIALLFTPLGVLAALAGALLPGGRWGPAPAFGAALLLVVLAASMFGAFTLAAPASLRRKLEAVGGEGGRGALAMGLVLGFLTAPTTLPLGTGLAAVVAMSGNGWLGGAASCSFAIGLGLPFLVAGTLGIRLGARGPWTAASTWISGTALGYLALAQLRDGPWALQETVRNPRYEPGLVAGAALLVGVVFAVLHVLAERKGSGIARLSKWLRVASILPAVVGGTLFFSWLPHAHGNAPPIAWTADEERGRAIALAESKPVVVVFNARWCCREVEHDMFFDPRVREEARRYVAIAVDASEDDDAETRRLTDKYRVLGVPTVILLDGAGQEVWRISEIVHPLTLAGAMGAVSAGHVRR